MINEPPCCLSRKRICTVRNALRLTSSVLSQSSGEVVERPLAAFRVGKHDIQPAPRLVNLLNGLLHVVRLGDVCFEDERRAAVCPDLVYG